MAKKGGFTLIEVMVVVAIVTIISLISVPLMGRYLRRSRAIEAESGLRAICMRMRLMRSQTGSYLDIPGTTDDFNAEEDTPVIDPNNAWPHVPGFEDGDLDGTFFQDDDYVINIADADSFVATATGNSTENNAESDGIVVTIDEYENVNVNLD